jgi:hypothetical protein
LRLRECRAQLLLEPGRNGVPATGKCPDHDPIGRVKVIDHGAGYMSEPA